MLLVVLQIVPLVGMIFPLYSKTESWLVCYSTNIPNKKYFPDGVFPKSLKLANVIPIFKSGNKCMISNYRPIFILPLFPKNVYNLGIDFTYSQNILYKFQFGFRKQFSTSHDFTCRTNKIRSSIR